MNSFKVKIIDKDGIHVLKDMRPTTKAPVEVEGAQQQQQQLMDTA